jgi:hypothetical protein
MEKPAFCIFLGIGLLPILISAYLHHYFFNELKNYRQKIDELRWRSQKLSCVEKRKDSYFKKFENANPYYLDQEIEPFVFLMEEKMYLENALKFRAFEHCRQMKDRLHFLTEENYLRFKEEKRSVRNNIEETLQKQIHPIEVNLEDLEKILSGIEGVALGDKIQNQSQRPQMLIENLQLEKTPNGKNYFLNLAIIKRDIKCD